MTYVSLVTVCILVPVFVEVPEHNYVRSVADGVSLSGGWWSTCSDVGATPGGDCRRESVDITVQRWPTTSTPTAPVRNLLSAVSGKCVRCPQASDSL